jgi:hypothetical protein
MTVFKLIFNIILLLEIRNETVLFVHYFSCLYTIEKWTNDLGLNTWAEINRKGDGRVF